MMNLVLHGVGQPNIVRGNALARPITQISKRDRVDVILTNPPFGGEEEKTIQANFPADKQTAETAWLFLQLVIRQLKDGGRCGIVVPNGLLFGDGVGARIKKQLLDRVQPAHGRPPARRRVRALHRDPVEPPVLREDRRGRRRSGSTRSRRPRAARSTPRPSRCASRSSPTARPGGRTREENERAWRVPIADIEATDFNLDLRNPNRPDDLAHRPPAELLAELIENEREILRLLEELQSEVESA